MPQQSILIIEDEENLVEALKYNLLREGYQVQVAGDGEQGLEVAGQSHPDLIILDIMIMLPSLDGFEVCRILRRDTDTPILMLTAKGEEIDRVVGLELGADDYVVKPFSMRELLARVRAMLSRRRRSAEAPPEAVAPLLKVGDLEIDRNSHTVTLGGRLLDLKPREFDLILERVWGHDWVGDSRTVDLHIRGLREKIEADPARPEKIITIRGLEYPFIGPGSPR